MMFLLNSVKSSWNHDLCSSLNEWGFMRIIQANGVTLNCISHNSKTSSQTKKRLSRPVMNEQALINCIRNKMMNMRFTHSLLKKSKNAIWQP